MHPRKIAGLTGAAALTALALTGCAGVAPAPDVVALHYQGGSFSSTKFEDCKQPGTRSWIGWGDHAFEYPAGQRTYRFTDDDQGDTKSLNVAASSKDGSAVTLKTEGFVAFTLNVSCAPEKINGRDYKGGRLQFFHEQVGLKNWGTGHAYIDGDGEDAFAGWGVMLDTVMGQPLQRAINDAAQGQDWRLLYNDPSAKSAWEKRVKELLPTYVGEALGFNPFRIDSVTIQKPTPPDNLLQALAASEEARLENAAQAQRNAKTTTELEGIRAQVKVLGVQGYVQKYAIDSGKVTVLPVPQGSNLTVSGK